MASVNGFVQAVNEWLRKELVDAGSQCQVSMLVLYSGRCQSR